MDVSHEYALQPKEPHPLGAAGPAGEERNRSLCSVLWSDLEHGVLLCQKDMELLESIQRRAVEVGKG